MKDYKRWTERAKDGSPALISERIFYEIVKSQGQGRKHYFADNGDVLDIVTRYLAELEDKIENGTLVEIGYHLRKSYKNHDDQRYKIVLIDEIEIDEIGYDGLTKAEAEAKLRELKGERE